MTQSPKSGWQPIETAPRDGTRFDVWIPSERGGWRATDLHFNERGAICRASGIIADIPRWPTHWQPLPEPPEAA